MTKRRIKSVTLVELLIVIIVIGILATLGFVNYGPFKERTLDREAIANLRLIMAAEKIYRMEYNEYFSSGDNAAINQNFRLMLPTGASKAWDYSTDAPDADHCCAEATRTGGSDIRSWNFDEAMDDPVEGACP
jgi:prepilin-type N-terminal cleavage/methylation domain-containing protein